MPQTGAAKDRSLIENMYKFETVGAKTLLREFSDKVGMSEV